MVSSGEEGGSAERRRDGRLLRLLLETRGDVSAARVDRDLRHTWVHNPNPEPPESEILGHRDDDLFPAVDVEPTVRLKREAMETGERVTEELTVHKPWGTRHYEAVAEPIREDGEVVGASFLAFDETEERRLRERTRALRRQNERLEEFAGIVSHDLRNPLNVAQGSIDLVRIEEDLEHLEAASRALARMETLVEDLLTLARQGRHITDPGRVSLAAVATQAWRTTETGDGSLEVGSDAPVLADGERLLGLFENLFRNSVEHGSTGDRAVPDEAVERGSAGRRTAPDGADGRDRTPAGRDDGTERGGEGVRVRVGVLDGSEGFYVEDDGVGIDPADRERVFGYGFSTSEEGAGFGLAIVQNVAHAHGWDVAVVGGAEGGARFEVTNVSVLE